MFAPEVLKTLINESKKTKSLDLSHRNIQYFPEEILKLGDLESLNISHNSLSFLPESIIKLKSLKVLDVSNNKLTEIPSKLGDLSELRRLNISNNQIEVIPPNFYKLPWTGGTIDIRNNPIKNIPHDVLESKSSRRIIEILEEFNEGEKAEEDENQFREGISKAESLMKRKIETKMRKDARKKAEKERHLARQKEQRENSHDYDIEAKNVV